MNAKSVVVVGAGWAGLAAAVGAVRRGHRVAVFDAAPQPGGRARTAPALDLEVDNGQHVAIGAYSAVLDLARTIGLDADAVFRRHALALEQRDERGLRMSLRARPGAGRAALAHAFLTARGLTMRDKLAMVRGWSTLARDLEPDHSVAERLAHAGQTRAANELLWIPLCLATLNTRPDEASARLFARVLREAFGAMASGAADLMLPACDLGSALPRPAVEWLQARGADVRLSERVTTLVADDRARGIVTARGEYATDAVVVATPPDACARLLAPVPALAALAESLQAFDTQPICTVYLRYPDGARLADPLVGLTGTTTQWLVDRASCGQPGVIAAVISADGPHLALDNDALVRLVADEVERCVPSLGLLVDARVIREKRATFAATVGIDGIRPGARTPMPGILLAGDWTATGLPATLEGAVRSGNSAAEAI